MALLRDKPMSTGRPTWASGLTGTNNAICPDALRLSDLGVADGWRGHVVRGFFRVLKLTTGL